MKRYNITLKKISLYSLGTFWITFFIYFRFIREHSFYELKNIKTNVTGYLLYANIAFILLHVCLISFAVYLINQTKKESFTPNKIVAKIQNIFNILILKPLESIRDLIAPELPGSGVAFSKVSEFIEKNIGFRSKMLVISFYFIPRILIAFIFFIELILYNKIEYFIYSLFLVIIPVGFSLFVNLFINFGERCIRDIPNNVKVIGIGEPLCNGLYSKYRFQPLPQYTYEEEELKEWGDTWFMALNIYTFGETYIKGFKNKVTPYITLITSSLYLSASIYKLIYILY